MKCQVLYSRIRACTLLAGLAVLVALAPSAHGQTVTIAPTSRALAFSTSQPVGITSAAQTVTMTNSGTTAVTISSIASSLLDYTQTNNCGTSLAAHAACTVSVVFAPTATGSRPGRLTITDNATGSPQTITLAGSGSLATLTSIALGGNATLTPGAKEQLRATGTYTGGLTADLTGLSTWTSSNTGAVTVGSTTGLATGVATGSSTITAAVTGTTVKGTGSLSVSGTSAPPSIAISTTTPSILVGGTAQFTVTLTNNGVTQTLPPASVKLASSNPSVATINTSGVATALVAGNTSITATLAGVPASAPFTLTVTAKTVTSVTLAAPATAIYPLGTDQFTATVHYNDGTSGAPAANTVTFASSSPAVATINGGTGLATGVVTAAGGTTNITATVTGGPTSAPFALSVRGVSIVVTPANPAFPLGLANAALAFGPTNNSLPFTAAATYTDNTPANIAITWSSSSTTVATISSSTGTATALAQGSTTITAAFGAVVGSTLLTVQPAILESITVAPNGISLGLNGTEQFTATGNYSDGSTGAITTPVTWTSAQPQVVSVGTTGLSKVLAATNVAVAITASSGTIAPFGSTNTAFVSALSTLPVVCPSPTIDLKLLVINNAAAGYADFPAIQQILNYVGTPYDVVDVSSTLPALSDDTSCHGFYQGIIFAFGDDIYNNSAMNSTLNSYQVSYGVRRLNWYTNPTADFGLNNATGTLSDTQTDAANFTAAAGPIFFYANTKTPVTIANAFAYLTTPTTPSGGGTVTPLLVDGAGNTLSAITQFSDGRQYLSQTFDSNPFLMHDLVLAYGLVNWVTKGVFLGDYHVYATQQVDDFFIDDSEWIPSTPCLTNLLTRDRTLPDASNLPVFRLDASDMAQLAAWQQTKQTDPLLKQFQITLAFNGVGTVGNGDWTGLTAPIVSSSAANGVASFTAQDFSGLPGQAVTVTGTTNGGGALNGTWTIVSETSSAATTPGTTTFTVTVPSTITAVAAAERAATASVPDDLVSSLSAYQGSFYWISHTYDHPSTLNGLLQSSPAGDINDNPPVDDIDLEILTNQYVAGNGTTGSNLDLDPSDVGIKPLNLTNFNPGNIVTPGVTGLNDPNVPAYLFNDGIRFAVSDTSVAATTNPPNNNGPNPSPNVGIVNSYANGIYEVPRYPNDVFYNTANWADDDAEFVCIYSNYVPPGSPAGTVPVAVPPYNTFTAAQVLDFVSSSFVVNMLKGDMDPEMFHQPDLHFSDNGATLGMTGSHISSLISDTYDQTFSKYEALYILPVLTPTLDQMGTLMQNRNSFNLSGVTASIIAAGTANAQLTITMPTSATVPTAIIPVTGLTTNGGVVGNGYETYGGQNISHINITAGQTITFPLQ
jgi:Bacterial Ig-like domain (group 2)